MLAINPLLSQCGRFVCFLGQAVAACSRGVEARWTCGQIPGSCLALHQYHHAGENLSRPKQTHRESGWSVFTSFRKRKYTCLTFCSAVCGFSLWKRSIVKRRITEVNQQEQTLNRESPVVKPWSKPEKVGKSGKKWYCKVE